MLHRNLVETHTLANQTTTCRLLNLDDVYFSEISLEVISTFVVIGVSNFGTAFVVKVVN